MHGSADEASQLILTTVSLDVVPEEDWSDFKLPAPVIGLNDIDNESFDKGIKPFQPREKSNDTPQSTQGPVPTDGPTTKQPDPGPSPDTDQGAHPGIDLGSLLVAEQRPAQQEASTEDQGPPGANIRPPPDTSN